ncbi:hypothetical protein ACFO8O_00860 [Hephaestia sp. GCM10023244]|uniref:hypothetical protein n=1 Tax=unclassified Hephaestia TaxID=2631281 RepID=UPI0020776F40|nr:hypothetical protein [Hephaestia sp. MAHUQ-44]MCM8729518.1 hypothetical protein [Hephaestia sp. MAHUQ-44]
MIRTSLIALVLLGGCATTAQDQAANADRQAKTEAEIADTLKGLTPGEPKSCIDQTRVQNVRKYAGAIIYEYSPREKYRNNVSDGCFGLSRGDIIVTKTPTSQLCRGEIITMVSPGSRMPSGSCGLGDFVPYKK